ncbi:MAG: uncharacterized protein JWM27_2465, partial [Gemmatimonadetes bacterium]|nr:uncharacterized protein [Gemmatimonadota bacterium]
MQRGGPFGNPFLDVLMFGIESLLVGRTLADRYRIEEVVGRGRTGPVCRAVDVRLGFDVAVKAVASGAQTVEAIETFRARFQKVAAAAALVHHPNVAAVYDCGTDPAINLDFLVMELLRGEHLGSRLAQRGRPPVPLGLRMLLEAVHGLSAVHAAGVAHGDLRPENLFLTRSEDGRQVRVRLLAFGLAPLAAAAGGAVPPLQATGAAAYVAPEQLRAGAAPTAAGDVFSLGAVGFLILTGTAPFSDAAILAMASGQRVAIRSPRELNPDIPPELAAVILRAISADASARFPDATHLLAALEPLVAGLPLSPARPAAAAPSAQHTLVPPPSAGAPGPASATQPVSATAAGVDAPAAPASAPVPAAPALAAAAVAVPLIVAEAVQAAAPQPTPTQAAAPAVEVPAPFARPSAHAGPGSAHTHEPAAADSDTIAVAEPAPPVDARAVEPIHAVESIEPRAASAPAPAVGAGAVIGAAAAVATLAAVAAASDEGAVSIVEPVAANQTESSAGSGDFAREPQAVGKAEPSSVHAPAAAGEADTAQRRRPEPPTPMWQDPWEKPQPRVPARAAAPPPLPKPEPVPAPAPAAVPVPAPAPAAAAVAVPAAAAAVA